MRMKLSMGFMLRILLLCYRQNPNGSHWESAETWWQGRGRTSFYLDYWSQRGSVISCDWVRKARVRVLTTKNTVGREETLSWQDRWRNQNPIRSQSAERKKGNAGYFCGNVLQEPTPSLWTLTAKVDPLNRDNSSVIHVGVLKQRGSLTKKESYFPALRALRESLPHKTYTEYGNVCLCVCVCTCVWKTLRSKPASSFPSTLTPVSRVTLRWAHWTLFCKINLWAS